LRVAAIPGESQRTISLRARARISLEYLAEQSPGWPVALAMMSLCLVGDCDSATRITRLLVFVCASASSIAGFAFSPLAGSLLLQTGADPVHAVAILLVASISIQAYSVWLLRHAIKPAELLCYFAGGSLTIGPGSFLLLHTPIRFYLLTLGAFLIAYGSYAMLRPRLHLGPNTRVARMLIGALCGITGATAAFPGAFITIWCGAQYQDKEEQRAIYQPFILGMQLLALAVLAAFRPGVATTFDMLVYVPPAVIGARLGFAIFTTLSNAWFDMVVRGFLLLSGLTMLLRSF
jgi:uncharacterized membrane protein YfcA